MLLSFLLLFAGSLAAQDSSQLIEEIQFHGNRRIPVETVRARIFTRAGDTYDDSSLQRDFNSLWNTGFFQDIRIEREQGQRGWVIHIYLVEKPTIRSVDYTGLTSVTQSDVLERFRERKVGLGVENQYDAVKVKRAQVVLKELLAEHGRQFAEVRTEVRPIPPSAVGLNFIVEEGPKVKVGDIEFEGNKEVGDRTLRRSMKNLHAIGIPYSIFLENLFSRTYDASKLSEDAERVRDAYQQRGFFKANVLEPKTAIRDTKGWVPFFRKPGKAVDITLPVEEGAQYTLNSITFENNKAVKNEQFLRSLFPIEDGAVFNTADIRTGLENLRKAYGELGYINFTSVPDTRINDENKTIDMVIDVDEGKPFLVRRIEFQGNTTTRDKVIRRELPIEEGHVYNDRLWEIGLLRLNQLQYFEELRPEEDSERKLNEQDGTVDLTLKVKEKGKNSIGLTGGVSGFSGSFLGINYQTNNFLGLGETLRVEANLGDRERNLLFGFTEPYLFDRPLLFGFTVYTRKFEFNQARQTELVTGVDLDLDESVLQTLQNYNSSSTGFTTSFSYPLRRSFKRVGLTYSFDKSSIDVFSDASRRLFETLDFRGISGPESLQGIVTSKVLPSFSFSTIDSPMRPTRGKSLYIGGEVSGLGGNVRYYRPIVEWKQFVPVNRRRNVFGYRLQGSFISGFGDTVAPPAERFYMGGDTDIRGFDIRTISPVAFLTDVANFPLLNPDGTPVPKEPGNPRRGNVTVPIPIRRILFPGGDTSVIANAEYRVPIAGPVTIAAFTDFGMNFITRDNQLRIAQGQLEDIEESDFGCSAIVDFECVPTGAPGFEVERFLSPVSDTNYQPRMSTGIELQIIMPVVNAPFRIYYAYNPLRLDTSATTPNNITREMFPAGGAGDFTFEQARRAFGAFYRLREPKSTFRFTVSTTF